MQCSPMSIFHNIYQGLLDACYILRKELQLLVKDEGVIIFFILVPLVYPLLYSWIYNNEVVRDVPVFRGYIIMRWCAMSQSVWSTSLTHICRASSSVCVTPRPMSM